MQHAPDASYVFISYASADRERVLPVVDALEHAGIPVWIDRDGIHGGENYAAEIADAIEGCAAFLLMTSVASLASRNVKQEIALAWEYERAYVPLLLEVVVIPKEVKYWLTAAQWIEVLDTPEAAWLPQVLTALEPLGIAPEVMEHEEVRLAGRERELALLRERLTAAKEGKGGLVLIGGEAGIGKTTLAEAILHDARAQGCAVLEGHCFDLSETPPYGPWLYLFERYPASAGLPPLPDAFAEPGRVGDVTSQAALFRQVLDFLKAVTATRPLVLLLDDYHWADPASLDLLRFLARSVATLPALLLVTYRSDELTRRHPLYQLLPLLVREAGAARLDLHRLDDDAVQTLITNRYHLPESATARLAVYLQTRAEGNALFLGELLRSLEEAGVLREEGDAWTLGELTQVAVPLLLRQVIDGRLARLGEETQRLLGVAAVIGHEVPLTLWATVGEVHEEALLDVVEQGVEARLLIESPDGERVQFAHALIRETLYEGMLTTRRRRMHRAIGESLAALPTPDPDAVAFHFQRAGDGRAVAWLMEAGDRAYCGRATESAMERYETALALTQPTATDAVMHAWLAFRLLQILYLAGRPNYREYLDVVTTLAPALADPVLDACLGFYRGSIDFMTVSTLQGIWEMEDGLAAMDALPPEDRARLDALIRGHAVNNGNIPHTTLIVHLANAGRFREAIVRAERMLREANMPIRGITVSDITFGDAYGGVAQAYANVGRVEDAREAFARSREAFRTDGNVSAQLAIIAYRELAQVALPYRTEEVEERRRLAGEAIASAPSLGERDDWTEAATLKLPLLLVEGEWDEASGIIGRALDAATPRSYMNGMNRAAWTFLARERGDAGVAWEQVGHLLPAGPETEPGSMLYPFAVATIGVAAALALDAGDLPTARLWLEAHGRWLAASGAVLGLSEGQALWAQYHRQAGDMDKARDHAERALAHATEPRQPLALLAVHRLLGELDTEAGRHADADKHLAESLALATACEAPYERALTLLALAELRAAMGETDAARALVDEVRVICEPLGAQPALARADALAARLTQP